MRKRILLVLLVATVTNCAGMSGKNWRPGENTKPANKQEAKEYIQGTIRCFKTGGSRIVKINGILRCF